jgi:oligoribonuclease
MHTASGLLDAIRAASTSVEQAEQQVLDYVREHVPDRRKAPLCGNTISTDRTFIAHYMPTLDDHLHYRMIDVSSIKELARRWYSRTYFNAPQKNGGHRAMADILESINELKYYRRAIMVPSPGPDSATARSIVRELGLEPPDVPES